MFSSLAGAAGAAIASAFGQSDTDLLVEHPELKLLPKSVRGVKSNRYRRWGRVDYSKASETQSSARNLRKMHKTHFEEVKITPRQEGAFNGQRTIR